MSETERLKKRARNVLAEVAPYTTRWCEDGDSMSWTMDKVMEMEDILSRVLDALEQAESSEDGEVREATRGGYSEGYSRGFWEGVAQAGQSYLDDTCWDNPYEGGTR